MTRAAIKHGEEQLRQAILASDVAVLDALLDDSLMFIGPTGTLMGKEDDLENHRSGRQKVTRLVTRDTKVQLFDADVAIATVEAELEGTFDGHPFSGTFRYLRTWQRSHGAAWRIIAGSVVSIESAVRH